MRYNYKDFVTGKRRWTSGEFIGFTNPTGLLDVPYAIFRRRSGDLLVPEYLLTLETRTALADKEPAP